MADQYTTKLLKKEVIAKDTMAFYFEKPHGFTYQAGQNADYFLINPPETDTEGNKRTFSLITTPEENRIGWATRMRDTAFKRVMQTLSSGAEIQVEGPYGDMTLHSRVEKPAVFLAGGIGITPFYSMVCDATRRHLPHRIFLFYSNHGPEDAPFLKELIGLEQQNPNFKLIATMTDTNRIDTAWPGETGRIDSSMLKKYLGSSLDGPIYYLAGPPAMVTAMKNILAEAGANTDDIRTEEFTGY